MTVPALFSCSLVDDLGVMWSGADDALDPAPPAAVLLRARCMCSGPRTHLRTATGLDQRARQDRQVPFLPLHTWSFAGPFCAGAVSC